LLGNDNVTLEGTLTDEANIWGPLGEKWWRENGEACKASEQQIRFAAARHNGATRSRAAQLAGYKGDSQTIRSAGSRVDDTDTVKNLLVLAAAAAAGLPTVDPVTVREAKDKVGKLVRSPDPTVALKAAELFVKLEQAEKQRGESPEDDGLSNWRLARDFLDMQNGASQFMLFYKGMGHDLGWPGNYPLLHDVYHLAQKEPFGQQIWDFCCQNCSEASRADLEKKLGDPTYQSDMRRQIWGEINKRPPGPFDGKVIDWRVKGERAPVNGALQ
jgi:hypothetical protein